jgi:hypothetical protein
MALLACVSDVIIAQRLVALLLSGRHGHKPFRCHQLSAPVGGSSEVMTSSSSSKVSCHPFAVESCSGCFETKETVSSLCSTVIGAAMAVLMGSMSLLPNEAPDLGSRVDDGGEH